jgi:phosphoribosylanthranilate isomerase
LVEIDGMVTVKICGVRRVVDALAAIGAGADEIGLLVGQRHTSGDFISPETAAEIAAVCASMGGVTPVLVTHVTDPVEVHALARRIGVNAIQVHSEMPPEGLAWLKAQGASASGTGGVVGDGGRGGGYRLRKSWHVTDPESLGYGDAYRGVADAFLLDSANGATGQVGGTGKVHDWSLSAEIVRRFAGVPVIVAGGLNAENVAEAVRQIRPAGVDVNSGTKGADGFKDAARMRAFVRAAKGMV